MLDILFYLKYFLFAPFVAYWIFKTIGTQRIAKEAYQRKLTRDREMERSFLPERSMNDLVMKAFQWGEANFGYFADNLVKGGSAADTEHARKTETEKDLRGNILDLYKILWTKIRIYSQN